MKNLGKEVIISPRFTSDEWGVKQLSDQPVVSGISARHQIRSDPDPGHSRC